MRRKPIRDGMSPGLKMSPIFKKLKVDKKYPTLKLFTTAKSGLERLI